VAARPPGLRGPAGIDAVLAVAAFLAGAVVSLATSWLLVIRLERVGERLGLSEALLGVVAALAADAPEVTAAVSALAGGQQRVGAGVVLGSNVFNLAALLGLGAVVAGRIGLHRKVVALGGVVAMWVALVCLAVVAGVLPVAAGLVLAVAVLVLYVLLLGTEGRSLGRLGLPRRWARWLRSAVSEEEAELEEAIRPGRGRWPDAAAAAAALVVVIVASVTMERAASDLGQRHGVPQIVTGGLVLAAVTSLPNAVAAVYLAARGRGAATLSTALNSNTLNVVAGLLLPGALIGLGRPSAQAGLVTAWYVALTLAVLALAYRYRGLGRGAGLLVIAAYAVFAASVLASGYALAGIPALAAALGISMAVLLAAALAPFPKARRDQAPTQPSPPTVPGARPGSGDAPAVSGNGHRPGVPARAPVPGAPPASRESLLPGWPTGHLWALSLLLPVLVASVDAALGPVVVLIGLLIVGPCSALLTGRWVRTALTGLWAVSLAVVLGLPDGIWASTTHLAFIAAVASVALVATAAAALLSNARFKRPGN
jgi:cation:H+ antiporter